MGLPIQNLKGMFSSEQIGEHHGQRQVEVTIEKMETEPADLGQQRSPT